MTVAWLSRALSFAKTTTQKAAKSSRRPTRLGVENLEERAVMSTVQVVPLSQAVDATHRHSLADAMPFAGVNGTVVIEPGATADAGTVNITISGLTIKGDPNVPGSILGRYDLNVNSNNVTLNNVNLGNVTVAATANHLTVSRSSLVNFTETGAASGVGSNILSQNTITGSVDLQGNSGAAVGTGDVIDHNSFTSTAPVILKLTNSNNTTISDNTFVGDANGQVGIQVRSNSDSVTILHNKIDLNGAGQPYAVVLISTGGAAGNLVSAKVLDNVLDAGPAGTGLYMNLFGTGSGFVAQVEGNDLRGNKVGVDVNGVPGATGAGNVDLGGGTNVFGSSKGGNDFRGYDGVNGHVAINLHNTDANVGVTALRNAFDIGINPNQVIRDGANNGGSGFVNAAVTLSADGAYIDNLYTKILGRAADVAAGELNYWLNQLSTKGQASVTHDILYSAESLARVVNGYYITYLGRSGDSGGINYWVGQIQAGTPAEQVEAGFISSPEYLAHINTDYVQSLYINILGRTGSASELAFWNNLLPSQGLKGIAASFTQSQEHRINAITEYFRDLLHRDPVGAEATNLASQPGDLLAIEATILSGQEFYQKG